MKNLLDKFTNAPRPVQAIFIIAGLMLLALMIYGGVAEIALND